MKANKDVIEVQLLKIRDKLALIERALDKGLSPEFISKESRQIIFASNIIIDEVNEK